MKNKLTGILSLLLLTGCLSETGGVPAEVISARSPANSDVGIRQQPKSNIIGEYNHRSPTGPGEWRKLNDEQTNPMGGRS